jgi:cysteine-rich repeat protein
MLSRMLAPALLALLAFPAAAQPAPGDLLATEAASGSVVNIKGGGDFTGDPRFATGLTNPTGICLGPGGDVYVAEPNGDILIVTAGGDFSAAASFATGLGNVLDLSCSETQILAVDNNSGGRILDATAGGDLSAAVPFASGFPLATRLFRDSEGTLWVTTASGEIFDVTAGGDFSSAAPFASGLGQGDGLTEHEGRLLVGDGGAGEVIDFTNGGNLASKSPFATSVFTSALLSVPGLGLFAAAGNGSGVQEISAGGSFSGVPFFASGVATTFGLAGLLYVPGCGDGIEQQGESCDDGNTAAGDGCSAVCALEPLCGATPAVLCFAAGKGKLSIDERKAGKEKLSLSLAKLAGPIGSADLGDPVSGSTRYGVCLYDASASLVGELQVSRAGETCGKKPCWKVKGATGLSYKDKDAADSGVTRLSAKGGDPQKGKLSVAARNKASKGQTALPALAAALAGQTAAIAQVTTSDAGCFDIEFDTVKRAETQRFQASLP